MANDATCLQEITGARGFITALGVASAAGFEVAGGKVESDFAETAEIGALGELVSSASDFAFWEVSDVNGASGLRGATAEEGFTTESGVVEAGFDSSEGGGVVLSILLPISMTNTRISAQGVGKFVIHCQKAVV